MQRKGNFIPFFLAFFSLSILIIIVGKLGFLDGISSLVNGYSNSARGVFEATFERDTSENFKKLSDENLKLRKELADKNKLNLENKALKDQFNSSLLDSQSLIPAKVIGSPGFIPGVSIPEYLVIDKGEKDRVLKNDTVVVGNYLIGKVVNSLSRTSKVELIIHRKSALTAKVSGTQISGVIKGRGNGEMALENVILSQTLKKGSEVLTKGSINEKGEGYPPDLVVGKIISIEKKSSDLFQKANVQSPIDFINIEYVFVLK